MYVDENNINYSDILKKYERPINPQRKTKNEERKEETNVNINQQIRNPLYQGLLIGGGLAIYLWVIGNFQDLSIAKGIEKDYTRNNGKLNFTVYENSLSSKKA